MLSMPYRSCDCKYFYLYSIFKQTGITTSVYFGEFILGKQHEMVSKFEMF